MGALSHVLVACFGRREIGRMFFILYQTSIAFFFFFAYFSAMQEGCT